MSNLKRMAVAVVAATVLAGAAASAARAEVVQVNSATFVAQPPACSCVTTIDGYLFSGMPYYDGTTSSAVGLWFALRALPGYVSYPPITSVSTTVAVSGVVGPQG